MTPVRCSPRVLRVMRRCRPGMVYKWAALIDSRCASVPRKSAADIGGRIVGHDIVTEQECSQNLRQ
jgi:hypothetical protein